MGLKNGSLKIVIINITFVLVAFFAPAIIFELYKQIKFSLAEKPSQETDPYAIYMDKAERDEVIAMHGDEKASTAQPMMYQSFIGWRRPTSQIPTSQIILPYNQRASVNQQLNGSSWFFGNSTMWGTGTSQNYTIPSQYAKKTGKTVTNFGESAWVSRQSLNQLLNAIGDGYKPKEVIFYGGAGDILQGCRAELTNTPSHVQEPALREMTSNGIKYFILKDFVTPTIDFVIMPYKAILGKLGKYENTKATSGSTMDCSSDSVKAQNIANHLVNNWKAAYVLSKSNGAKFLAILQPLAQTSDTPTNHFEDEGDLLRDQFKTVYPLILNTIKRQCKVDPGFCNSFVDGQRWIKTKEPVFIDFSHLTGSGNEIVAHRIADFLK